MIVCAIAAIGANAQKNAIAVVDMNYILKNVPAYESATEQLNQVSLKWKKEIDASAAEAKSMYENYQTRHAANEKRYLEALEKKKGLPAQKLRELVGLHGGREA